MSELRAGGLFVGPLIAEAGISILNTSTYRTDIVFVDEARFEAAVAAVKRALITLHYTHLSQQ